MASYESVIDLPNGLGEKLRMQVDGFGVAQITGSDAYNFDNSVEINGVPLTPIVGSDALLNNTEATLNSGSIIVGSGSGIQHVQPSLIATTDESGHSLDVTGSLIIKNYTTPTLTSNILVDGSHNVQFTNTGHNINFVCANVELNGSPLLPPSLDTVLNSANTVLALGSVLSAVGDGSKGNMSASTTISTNEAGHQLNVVGTVNIENIADNTRVATLAVDNSHVLQITNTASVVNVVGSDLRLNGSTVIYTPSPDILLNQSAGVTLVSSNDGTKGHMTPSTVLYAHTSDITVKGDVIVQHIGDPSKLCTIDVDAGGATNITGGTVYNIDNPLRTSGGGNYTQIQTDGGGATHITNSASQVVHFDNGIALQGPSVTNASITFFPNAEIDWDASGATMGDHASSGNFDFGNLAGGKFWRFNQPLQVGGVLVPLVTQVFPNNITLWSDQNQVSVGNALSTGPNVLQCYNTVSFQSASANADASSQSFSYASQAPATTQFKLLYVADANNAIVSVLIDSVSIGSIDTYNVVPAYNQIYTVSGLTLTPSNTHTIEFLVTGKNGASTGYDFESTKFWIADV